MPGNVPTYNLYPARSGSEFALHTNPTVASSEMPKPEMSPFPFVTRHALITAINPACRHTFRAIIFPSFFFALVLRGSNSLPPLTSHMHLDATRRSSPGVNTRDITCITALAALLCDANRMRLCRESSRMPNVVHLACLPNYLP